MLQMVLELTIELQIKIKTFFHFFASIVISQVPTQAPLSLLSAASQLPQDFWNTLKKAVYRMRYL